MSAPATARPRRSQSRARTVRQATYQVPAATQQVLARHDLAMRHQQYEIAGRLESAILDDGRRIEFLKQGPTLAYSDGELLVLNDWQGLPDLRTLSNELCPDCLAACDECEGKGKRKCQLTGCGGSGRLLRAGVKRKDMHKLPTCPRCNGKGKATCDLCRGSGKMATGKQDGSLDANALDCASCGGQKRKATSTAQTFSLFAIGRLGTLVALGPIQCFVVRRPGRREEGGGIQVMKVLPDADGNLSALLVQPSSGSSDGSPGSRAWIVGGRPQFGEVSVSTRYARD
jgi:hypothetical protein